MRCSLCADRAVSRDPRFCEYHFNRYIHKKVDSVLQKVIGIHEKRILVAVSGGKDSSALAHILSEKLDNIELFYIYLGIPGYSTKGLDAVKSLSKLIGIPLNTFNLFDLNFTMKTANNWKSRISTCSICGTIKRYIANKFAYENGFDYVATGHNFTDMSAMAFLNLATGNLDYSSRLASVQHPRKDLHLAGTIKPFFHVPESNTLVYVLLHKLPFYSDECPYSTNNTQIKAKSIMLKIKDEFPSFPHNLLKLSKKLPKNEPEIKLCECGYPTTSKTCRFCRLGGKLKNLNQ